MATQTTIDQLNSFLRGEIAAVETYQMALAKLHEISATRDELLINLKSHQDRVMTLQDAIVLAGGEPAQSSGPWGTFAKAVEGGAKVLGEKAAIAALEEGEDRGVETYDVELSDLDPEARDMVVNELRPAQQQTHDRLSALKHRM